MIKNCMKNNQHVLCFKPVDNFEKKYLNQLINLVEKNIDDDSFKFSQFATEMANSKSTLYRRMKLLTGQTPMEFIRIIRLNHAVDMLLNNNCDIADIAYTLGFNDPKYFSRCFKTKFGLSPKEYKKMAISMLKNLSSSYQSDDQKPSFLLHSTGHCPNKSEIDASTIYADYYYIEALMRLKKIKEESNGR